MTDLKISAAEVTIPGRRYDNRRARYLQAISPIRQMILDDQVKLNDPGASQYLIETLARDGWNGLLRFYEARYAVANRTAMASAPLRLCHRRLISRRAARAGAGRPVVIKAGGGRRRARFALPTLQPSASIAVHSSDIS